MSPSVSLLVRHSFPAHLTSCIAFKRKTVFQYCTNPVGYSSRLQKSFMQNICILMTDSENEWLCPWHYGSNSQSFGVAALTITSLLIVCLEGVAEDLQNRCWQMLWFQSIPQILKNGHKILVLVTQHAIHWDLRAIIIKFFPCWIEPDLTYLWSQLLHGWIVPKTSGIAKSTGSQRERHA